MTLSVVIRSYRIHFQSDPGLGSKLWKLLLTRLFKWCFRQQVAWRLTISYTVNYIPEMYHTVRIQTEHHKDCRNGIIKIYLRKYDSGFFLHCEAIMIKVRLTVLWQLYYKLYGETRPMCGSHEVTLDFPYWTSRDLFKGCIFIKILITKHT